MAPSTLPAETAAHTARWYNAVRCRLTLWHTAALTLCLAAFAVGAYVFIARTMRERMDRSLLETSRVVVQAWEHEQAEGGALHGNSVRIAVGAVREPDARTLVYDDTGTLIAISDTAPLSPALSARTLAHAPRSPVAALLAPAAPTFVTIGSGDVSVRALATPITFAARQHTLIVLRSQAEEKEAVEIFFAWLLGAIPLALILAGGAGYALARTSLAPIVAMATQAEQISASSLHARLVASNPRDELGQLAGVLNRLLGRLEVSFAQQRQFMADASHELRTPVAIVRSAADIALDQREPTHHDLREALQVVSGEGRRMTRLVDDLFLLARADSGEQPVRKADLYLEEIIADAASAGRALGQRLGVSVDAEPADEAPFSGDGALLSRLVLNLVDNAVKHTPAGGQVRLSLATALDVAAADASRVWYRITVDDTGAGVDERVRHSLFERFVRADGARKHDLRSVTSGAGLGLSIARWIAKAHGGRLVLEHTGPDGSRFVLWLPAPAPTNTS